MKLESPSIALKVLRVDRINAVNGSKFNASNQLFATRLIEWVKSYILPFDIKLDSSW